MPETVFRFESPWMFLGLILHAMNWRFKELHNVLVRNNRKP